MLDHPIGLHPLDVGVDEVVEPVEEQQGDVRPGLRSFEVMGVSFFHDGVLLAVTPSL